ncbi:hypothetical protein CCHL11_02945 [Colletotrichum chlorophyti]|uniref:EthD domain-containing protein n=1 Tax=Colletotrichum chlorophyti TaxID=708187 RepID=A0A1Q8S175_9PEZI|nr:hypothetical protein CCHL11_02945 [Colletotrichum chlorophyti]
MTFKTLIFAHRLPGVSPAEFKDHYDNFHIPMVRDMTGALFPLTHTRQYIRRVEDGTARVLVGSQEDFDYDVVAEMVFEDEAAFGAFCGVLAEEENARRIDEDEKTFLDRSRCRVVVLGETDVTVRVG